MISILLLSRDTPQQACECALSLVATTQELRSVNAFELILIDDHSNPAMGMVEGFKQIRARSESPVQIIRFKSHQHYAHGLAYGFAAAKGSAVIFISHDMILAPACLRTLLELAALDRANGIVRPVSQHMDFAPECVLRPPFAMRSNTDVNDFSQLVRDRFGLAQSDWGLLIGDAMLVQRSVIDRIGVPDMRFFGFMADINYGLRAQRAGFRLPIAHGAWLHHLGKGHVKEAARDREGQMAILQKNNADADRAWNMFCDKWGTAGLEKDYRKLDAGMFQQLANRGPVDGSGDHHPPPALDPGFARFTEVNVIRVTD